MAETESIKYKDPNQPVAVRVKDLLGRMSLEEKIGQMVQIDRSMANAEVMKSFFIGKNHFFISKFLFACWIFNGSILVFVCMVYAVCYTLNHKGGIFGVVEV